MPAIIVTGCGRSVFRRASFHSPGARLADGIRKVSSTTTTPRKPRKPKVTPASNPEPVETSSETQTISELLANLNKQTTELQARTLRKTRPHAWTSRLERETLGASSSVLVLRDVEKKKIRHNLSRKQHEREDGLNVNQILNSIKGQNLDPEQQEVNKNLDSIRPDNVFSAPGRPPCISRETLDATLKALSEGFSQIQLARYITAVWTGLTTGDAQLDEHSKERSEQTGLSKYEWHALGHVEGARKPMSSTARGKLSLAHRIIRTVWGFEVREEIQSTGLLELRVDPRFLDIFLVGGNTSILREMSIEQKVKIDVNRSNGIIAIVADKYRCLEVAEIIQRLLGDVCTIDFDLKPFRAPRRKPNQNHFFQQLSLLAGKCQCAIEEDLTAHKIIIRSRNKADSEYCQRILTLAMLEMPINFGESITLNDQDVITGNLCAMVDSLATLPNIRGKKQSGRFNASYDLPKPREERAKRQVARTVLSDSMIGEIRSHLRNPCINDKTKAIAPEELNTVQNGISSETVTSPRWVSAPYSQLLAEPGYVLHEMKNNVTLEPLSASDLLERAAEKSKFSPTVVGLPPFLLKNFSESVVKRRDFLRIHFIPSPWAAPGLWTHRGIPRLNMMLTVNYATRSIQIESVEAILETRSVNVMLPQLGTDLRVLEENVLRMTDPAEMKSVREFVGQIQDTAAGYGSIRPPLFLRLPLPRSTLRNFAAQNSSGPSLDSEAAEVVVEYMSTGIEYVESLVYDYKGQELVLYHVGGGEFSPKYRALQLRHVKTEASSEESSMAMTQNEHDPQSSQPRPEELRNFLEQTSSLLRDLNLSFGNMEMLETKPNFSDVKQSMQRKSHTSMDHTTKQRRTSR